MFWTLKPLLGSHPIWPRCLKFEGRPIWVLSSLPFEPFFSFLLPKKPLFLDFGVALGDPLGDDLDFLRVSRLETFL